MYRMSLLNLKWHLAKYNYQNTEATLDIIKLIGGVVSKLCGMLLSGVAPDRQTKSVRYIFSFRQ